jgi:hypothetical protein
VEGVGCQHGDEVLVFVKRSEEKVMRSWNAVAVRRFLLPRMWQGLQTDDARTADMSSTTPEIVLSVAMGLGLALLFRATCVRCDRCVVVPDTARSGGELIGERRDLGTS